MSTKKVKDKLLVRYESDSDDDQLQKEDERDIIERIYEGGQAANKNRLQTQYEDDYNSFSARNSGITNGLVEKRGCTDMACLVIFTAFLVSLGYFTIYGYSNGETEKLIAPVYYDMTGAAQLCGEESKFTKNKYLYLTQLAPESMLDLFEFGMCVDECPKTADDVIPCIESKYVKCEEPIRAVPTYQVLNYCIPDLLHDDTLSPEVEQRYLQLWEQFQSSSTGSKVADLYLSSTAIWISIALAPIYCFLFIALMSAFAEPLAWLIIAVVQLGLIGGAVACYFYRQTLTSDFNIATKGMDITVDVNGLPGQATNDDDLVYKNLYNTYNSNMSYLMWGIVVLSILAFFFGCCVIAGCKSLKFAIDVIDASADFLFTTKRLIFVPILYFFVTMIIIVVWIGMLICAISINDIKASETIPQMKTIKWTSNWNYYLIWYMVFAIIWLVNFIEYQSKFIVQISAASFYFDSNSKLQGQANVSQGFRFAYLNHIGSLAIGSFIIGVITFLKIVFVYAARTASHLGGSNAISSAVLKCGLCYISCLEKVTDYINSSAYCYMAVSGENFGKSAWNGFLLNIKHLLKFSFSNFLASIFILLGKIGITTGNIFTLLSLMRLRGDMEEVSTIFGPCLVVGLFTYFTTSVFLGLFDTATMSMMTSLAIDMDINDGHPLYGPPTFHESCSKLHQHQHDHEEHKERFKKI